MKKILAIFGALFITLLLISSATACPQANSKTTMDIIDKLDQGKTIFKLLKGNIVGIKGILDWIIQLLKALLNFINQLIQEVIDLFQIVEILEEISSAINQLIDLIVQFINRIIDLFTPDSQNMKK